jgi:hypothetical protein
MGNTHIDIIWVIPTLVFVGWTWLVYRLGIEVGRVFQSREERAKRRHPSYLAQYGFNQETEYPTNVIKINRK